MSRRPRNGGIFALAFVTVFFVGLSIGGILFGPKSHPITSHDMTVLSYARFIANHAIIMLNHYAPLSLGSGGNMSGSDIDLMSEFSVRYL